MAYTKSFVEKLFPDIQWVGGKGILHYENRNVEMGEQAVDGGFIPSVKGKELLESANTSATETVEEVKPEPKPRKAKAKDGMELDL